MFPDDKAQLVPQLIINYKLKVTLSYSVRAIQFQLAMQSVAHLPMKAFVYKFLGTIVDDFFACVTYLIGQWTDINDFVFAGFVSRCQLSTDWHVSEMMSCSSFSCINDGSTGLTPNVLMRYV